MKKNKNSYRKFQMTGVLLATLTISSCTNEPNYKVIRQEVIDLHDKLMADEEIVIRNKMALNKFSAKGLAEAKKLTPSLDTAAEQRLIRQLIAKLNATDKSMMDWMHSFKADVEEMNNVQAVTYFNNEKKKLVKLDSLYKVALEDSGTYLKKFGVSLHPVNDGHDHSKHE